jgi:acyl-CoA hydrolase/GNAT superfamily N-acetyltransferase
MSLESVPLTMIANQTDCHNFNIRSFYLGSAKPKLMASNKRFITPLNLSAVPRLFKSRLLHLHVALIQVSPPDDFGWMSLGVSVDVTMAAAQSADLVIAQVNSHMPKVLGRSFIHVNDVDIFVEYEEDLLTVDELVEFPEAQQIASHVARLIDDGSTLEVNLGATSEAILRALSEKNDLGVHTQFLTNGILQLFYRGVITNRKKWLNEGKLVASGAIGSADLYEFLHDNPGIEFYPSDYVNDPNIISQHNKMVSIYVAMAIDLTGQVAIDALPYNHFSGVTGIMDFVRGASQSEGGKSILMLPSLTMDHRSSRILPTLKDTAVVVPRGDVHYVATEFGVVNLFGKSLRERAVALIGIAHPNFRDRLLEEAKKLKLVSPDRTLKSMHAVYPVKIEEVKDYSGRQVLFRPAKPADERAIQEHFYNLDRQDVVARFMAEKTTFLRDEMAGIFQVDYVKNMCIVGVIGDVGFEEVIAVGGYFLDPAKNMAEVAFSVKKEWQRKGLSTVILKKLATAARENGISGFLAYTTPENQGMIKLFNKLPYHITTAIQEDLLALSSKFDDPVS